MKPSTTVRAISSRLLMRDRIFGSTNRAPGIVWDVCIVVLARLKGSRYRKPLSRSPEKVRATGRCSARLSAERYIPLLGKIGRASCRERVEILVVSIGAKKK